MKNLRFIDRDCYVYETDPLNFEFKCAGVNLSDIIQNLGGRECLNNRPDICAILGEELLNSKDVIVVSGENEELIIWDTTNHRAFAFRLINVLVEAHRAKGGVCDYFHAIIYPSSRIRANLTDWIVVNKRRRQSIDCSMAEAKSILVIMDGRLRALHTKHPVARLTSHELDSIEYDLHNIRQMITGVEHTLNHFCHKDSNYSSHIQADVYSKLSYVDQQITTLLEMIDKNLHLTTAYLDFIDPQKAE